MDQPAEPNSAALYNTRKRQGSVGGSQVLDSIVSASNCGFTSLLLLAQKSLFSDSCFATVDREEVDRLRKRFMKLDKVRRENCRTGPRCFC